MQQVGGDFGSAFVDVVEAWKVAQKQTGDAEKASRYRSVLQWYIDTIATI